MVNVGLIIIVFIEIHVIVFRDHHLNARVCIATSIRRLHLALETLSYNSDPQKYGRLMQISLRLLNITLAVNSVAYLRDIISL